MDGHFQFEFELPHFIINESKFKNSLLLSYYFQLITLNSRYTKYRKTTTTTTTTKKKIMKLILC